MKNSFEVMGESRVGSVYAVGVGDDGFPLCEQAGDGEGHRDAVVAETVNHRAVEWLAAVDFHAVFELLNLGSHRAQAVDDGGDAVGFLDAQFLGIADDGAALRERGGDGDDGNFIDKICDFLEENGGAC